MLPTGIVRNMFLSAASRVGQLLAKGRKTSHFNHSELLRGNSVDDYN